MKILITIMMVMLSVSSVFAGEMKEIDLVSRETVANTYYTGFDYEGYVDFMYSEIWNTKLEEKSVEGCLVVVSGMTTETVLNERNEVSFLVCINKAEDGSYIGELLN